MFLRSLVMKGFKSFAEPTALHFEPGMTVVVGPNGSGKSNVVDAVAWVLGAQGPRALRSQRMEDVIFMGTASRPALGRAEVSLTIDNSSGRLPTDLAEVTITRTLFRNGESEYAVNGTPCRLLDIQDLLADSGVGRSQHMIVGQGQLESVLSARPEDRRAVIEEAAGVLKHRRRRERAQRRLAQTEENLDRLGDLVREVRRQVRPLERQAAAARAHAAVAGELAALRLHLAGRELAALAERHEAAAFERAALVAEERSLEADLAALDVEAGRATAELSSAHHDDLGATVARVEGLVERARGLDGVLRERRRALAAALEVAQDTDVVANLEADAARLAGELEATGAEGRALEEALASLEAEERELDAQGARVRAAGPGSSGRGAAEALARTLERLAALSAQKERQRRAAEALAASASSANEAVAELEAALAQLGERQATAGLEADRRAAEAEAAEAEAAVAARALREAEGRAQAAAERRHRTSARAEALARALDELDRRPGRRALEGLAGVAGTLAELVVVDPGYEAAFEAAASGAEAAVVVEGLEAVRLALGRLHGRRLLGAVLAAGTGETKVVAPPFGCERLADHVAARPGAPGGLDGALGGLLASVVVAPDWQRALEVAAKNPEWVVVTREGDRHARGLAEVGGRGELVTSAAVAAAKAEATEAESAHLAAEEALGQARSSAEARARRVTEARRAEEGQRRELAAAQAERRRVEEALDRARAEVAWAGRQAAQAAAEEEALAAEVSGLEEGVAAQQAAAAAEELAAAEEARLAEVLAARRRELAARRRPAEVRRAEVAERQRVLAERSAELERRLAGHVAERQRAAARRERLEADLRAVGALAELVARCAAELRALRDRLAEASASRAAEARAQGERLESLHRRRVETEQRLQGVRQGLAGHDVALTELKLRAAQVTELIEGELDSGPEAAVAAPCPPLPEGVSAEQRADQLAERLAELGPVNPLALEELATLEERAGQLDKEVQDVRTARRELQHVISYLDGEIASTFLSAVADVNEHFSALAATLFPGGTGRLVLTEPERPLETGVEIEVRPPGRNVRRISLLSGGERSLVAIAFLFAVFRSRPSPFYLMDEVEAALDDPNLNRFLALVDQFRSEAQLIVVSHQKRTMETADALYGVTMAPGGSSQVVSQKVARLAPEAVGHLEPEVART